jgi:hydrogenase large subunit
MTLQTLDISPVGRVEGDLDIKVEVQDGVVTNAWTRAELFRGFEIILKGKDPQAGLIVTPRACGICGASHLTCAAWALDVAWKTEVPPNAILIRNVGQLTESLQSIPRWYYALFAIDYTNKKYASSPLYPEAVRRYAPFVGTSYEPGVTLSSKPVEVYAIFGGQWPHSSYMVPGGVMCAPTLSDMTRSRAILEYWKNEWLEKYWLGCSIERYLAIKSWADFQVWLDESPKHRDSDLGFMVRYCQDVGLDKYGGGVGKYIAYGFAPNHTMYNRPTIATRNAALTFRSGIYDGQGYQDFDQAKLFEHVAHSWYQGDTARHPFDGVTEPLDPAAAGSEKYSWAKAPRYDSMSIEAGSLAREVIAGRPGAAPHQDYDPLFKSMFDELGPSNMLRVWSRMHEACKYYKKTIEMLDAVDLKEPFYIKPKETDGEGFGATEAIRGALAHWVKIKGGKIENYQIMAPTTINVGPRDSGGAIGPIESSLIGAPIADATDPVEVGHCARSFDSCLVCTVHVHDGRTDEELARFQVP